VLLLFQEGTTVSLRPIPTVHRKPPRVSVAASLFWSALTCQRFVPPRPVAALVPYSTLKTAASSRHRPKRRQVAALQRTCVTN